jgi:outer membrane protein assembly factor BamB
MAIVPLLGTEIPQSRLDQGYVIAPPYTPPNTYVNAQGQSRQITAPSAQVGGSVGPGACSTRAGLVYMGGIDSPTNSGRSARSFVTAWEMSTGALAWVRSVGSSLSAGNGLAATAGDVVFFGESAGTLHAVDAKTGAELWSFPSGVSGSKGAPLVYQINGKDFVAIKSGSYVFVFSLP